MKIGDTYQIVVTRDMTEPLGGLHKGESVSHIATVTKVTKLAAFDTNQVTVLCSCGSEWSWDENEPS